MCSPASPARRQLSRQILLRVLLAGVAIVSVATVACYYLVYHQSKANSFAYLRKYMQERSQLENQTFLNAYSRLSFFRDEFLKLYLSDLDFSDDDFWKLYFVDEDGATRMKEQYFAEGIDAALGRTWGMSSFIGNNQSVAAHDLKRRLLIANILVRRYGPAWAATGILHATYPENAITIFSPDEPWGLKAKPDLPMNELGTIKATLQSENPDRKPVWTGLYYDETVDKWTITFEMPVDHQGRHLVNPSLDVQLESIMRRLKDDSPAGADMFIVSKNGFLIAHSGALQHELKRQGQLSLDKLGDPELTRMYREIRENAGNAEQGVCIVEDAASGNYLFSTSFSGPDWWFVMVLPKSQVAREAHQASRIVLLFGFLMFALYYITVYFVVSRQVKRPLSRLGDAVSLVASGEYKQVIRNQGMLPLELKNEIGQLARMFLEMCREVDNMRENLQGIVQSRTRELELANAKLRDLSLLDSLTGIHNRRSFDRDIALVFGQARRGVDSFSLLLADIDFFKLYNDTHGHTAGDEVLRRVAEVISATIRADDRVYRYGGEEIAVIFHNAGMEAASQTGARLIAAVREMGVAHPGSPHGVVTISAGLAEFDARFATATAMIDAADASLYQAKSGGRNALRIAAPPDPGAGGKPETSE